MGTLDGIIDTVSAAHPILPLLGLLKTNGKLVLVGAPNKPLELPVFPLLLGKQVNYANLYKVIKRKMQLIRAQMCISLSRFTIIDFFLEIGRKILAGSCIGGMKETQEMIDFAAKHNITAEIEVISMDYVNKAMERLADGDVKYRFVIDIANTLTGA